jgi:Fe2+ or Zn2+ uptake regulation protein
MIKLINGRGQLGTALNNLIIKEKPEVNATIYHTWNFLDKSKDVQKECYEKFKRFVDENKYLKIMFISTYSQTENYYNFYKQLSESYLINNTEKGYVIKLPTLIGKGICQDFKDNKAEAFGDMELMTIEDSAKEILDITKSDKLIRNIRINGAIIPAKIAKSLILFGKE